MHVSQAAMRGLQRHPLAALPAASRGHGAKGPRATEGRGGGAEGAVRKRGQRGARERWKGGLKMPESGLRAG